jgi:hypothetical protein
MSSSSDNNMVLNKSKVIFKDNESHYDDAEDDIDNVEGDVRGGLLRNSEKLNVDIEDTDLKIENKFNNKMVINLRKLSVHDLFDTGTFFDKQDPCLEITICEHKLMTERQQDAGTNANFPEKFEIMVDDVQCKSGMEMFVEVYR